ncbi:hypothetical protein MMC14_008771 [Varicellaria rhodocarpa]|nr:hypothetical protein [Varicellaria rhodocarpa]
MQQYCLKWFILTALIAPFTQAQSLSELPTCAEGPAVTAIGSTKCPLTDLKCICSNTAFLSSLQPVIQKDCSAADYAKALAFASQLCLSSGVTLSVPSAAAATASGTPGTSAISTSVTAGNAITTATSGSVATSNTSQAPTSATAPSSSAVTVASTPVPSSSFAVTCTAPFLGVAIGAIGTAFTLAIAL